MESWVRRLRCLPWRQPLSRRVPRALPQALRQTRRKDYSRLLVSPWTPVVLTPGSVNTFQC